MKYTVEFYMKGEPKECTFFGTYQEARAFMQGLAINDNCEAYSLVRPA